MNNKQVAHLWANQSRESASGSHFFFEGDTIYSYGRHFPIARHHEGIILFTSKDYSITTTSHKSYVRQACCHLTSFTVSDVTRKPCVADLKEYAAEIEKLSTLVARARDPQWKLSELETLIREANSFAEIFGFKRRFAMPDETTLATLREKSKLAAQKKAKQTAIRNAKIERENAESIQKWIAGEQSSLPYTIGKVYLRAKDATDKADGSNPLMQTSKGATVPLHEAEKAFRFVIAHRQAGWHRNGANFQVGEFQLDSVNEQGVIAGCHHIAWDEIERFAKTQNWI